jgi:phosphate/sulfate permease
VWGAEQKAVVTAEVAAAVGESFVAVATVTAIGKHTIAAAAENTVLLQLVRLLWVISVASVAELPVGLPKTVQGSLVGTMIGKEVQNEDPKSAHFPKPEEGRQHYYTQMLPSLLALI